MKSKKKGQRDSGAEDPAETVTEKERVARLDEEEREKR
jgi:hypothetical protein